MDAIDYLNTDLTDVEPEVIATYEKILKRGLDITENGCWISSYRTIGRGYSAVTIAGNRDRQVYVHQITYCVANGIALENIGTASGQVVLHHTCGESRCCNPEHLTLKDHLENCGRVKGVCQRGHLVHGMNAEVRSSDGVMRCRLCAWSRERVKRHLETRDEADAFYLASSRPLHVEVVKAALGR